MAKKEAKKKAGKRKLSTTLLWGLLGLVILLAGAASALYYMNRDKIQSDPQLKVVKDFIEKFDDTIEKGRETLEATLEKGKSVADSAKEKLGGFSSKSLGISLGGRTYEVQPGDNLWAIARESGLVDNPWEWRTIMMQNSDKIEYAFISEEEGAWKVMMAEGQELTVDEPESKPPPLSGEKKFAFQLASMGENGLRRATYVVRVMMKDGYYGYVNSGEKDGQTYYRIRSGFYDSEDQAKSKAEEIRERYAKENYFPSDPWVFPSTNSEMSGEEMVFGAQLSSPWVVELGDKDTHGAALKELRRISKQGRFTYIWQTRTSFSKRFVYRVRIGFFGSQKMAEDMIADGSGEMWEDAQPVKVEQMEETLPGQYHRLGDVN